MNRLIVLAVAGAVLLAPIIALAGEVEDMSEPPRNEKAPADEEAGHTAQPISGEAESGAGILNITSRPKHVEISLDGGLIGVSPISGLAVDAGEHVVRAEQAGYNILEARVTVETGEIKELHMELVERLEKSESWWGKNSVYFTIGAIVLGVGVILVACVGLAAAP
jgi:hypothetical protein